MIKKRASTKSVAFGLALVLATASLVAAQPPDPPPYYAIKDVEVVTVSGRTLDRATVLVADGLIEAVGPDIEIPGDAWVIEAEGLTLYPGMIDTLTTIAQKPAQESRGSSGGGNPFAAGDEPEIRGPEDRPQTTPWVRAAHDLDGSDGKIEKWRMAGFTSAISSPSDGFFAGEAALINLSDREPRDMVVAAGAAQRLNLRGGRSRSYPGALMGVISYLRQVFADAAHYGQAQQAYERSPGGLERPQYDRTLDPIYRAVEQKQAFLIPAEHARHIDRALVMADEFGIEPVIYGAQGAYLRAQELGQAKVAVLVDIDWPEREKDRDPESDHDFRDLAHEQLAPTTPARLAESGVRFAFASDDLSSPGDVLEGVREAVDSGLSEELALQALTLDAARIFGVDDRLGSIEVGKIANLVLASDLPWAEGVEVDSVFVDGRRYAERKKDEPSDPPASDVSGTWKMTMQSPRGEREMSAELTMAEDGKVSGKLESERGELSIDDGRMSGSTLSFTVSQSAGGRSFEATYRLEVEGEELAGNMSAGPMSMEVQGSRTAAATQQASASTESSDESTVTAEELMRAWQTYQGPVRTYDTLAVTNATIHTVSGEVIEGGTLLVQGGKIAAVGTEVRVPSDAQVIDAAGQHLTPGVIDAHSHLAIEGGVNEGSLAVTAMVGTGDVVDPDDVGIYRALAGGVTSANLLHGSANPIGGRNAVIKMRWGKSAEEMKLDGAPPGIKFALGENPKRSRSFPGMSQRYPATRMGVMDVIRRAFVEARQYREDWSEYESAKAAGRKALAPRVDFELQTLVEILDGERLVHAHSYRADEILQLLRLADEFGFKIATLQHVLEGYKVANEIAEHGAGASTFSDWWGYKVEAYDAIPYNAALMTERGVLVSINSDSAEEIRHLNQEAGKSMRFGGLDENQALRLVTLNPAKQLGIDEWVGSIEVGKDADFVLYDAHPLSVYAVAQKTFVDGDLYFDIEEDRRRQELIGEIEDQLLGKKDEDGGSRREAEEPPTATPVTPATTPDSPAAWLSGGSYGSDWETERYSCRESH